MNLNFNSKQGFTLIELLVVIGILAVLAAIAIPSVAGLIDRANVSSDKTNANEMTNAIERFASEYEIVRQDLYSGLITGLDNLDGAQGRVYYVTKVTSTTDIENLEKDETADPNTTGRAIYRDTKYPVNAETTKAIVEAYTKTSSSTFVPKQSDKHYYYSPDCGLVIVADKNVTDPLLLNKYVVSGMDAKGNELDDTTTWINLTTSETPSSPETPEEERNELNNLCYDQPYKGHIIWAPDAFVYFRKNGSFDLYVPMVNGIQSGTYTVTENNISISFAGTNAVFTISNNGNTITNAELASTLTLSLNDPDICFDGDYLYIYKPEWSGFCAQPINPTGKSTYGVIKKSINGRPVNSIITDTFANNNLITSLPEFENGFVLYEHAANGEAMFQFCENLKNVVIPNSYTVLTENMFMGTSMDSIRIPLSITRAYKQALNTNIGEIYFEGTVAQWNERGLSIAFADYSGVIQSGYTIICSDGTITT